MIPGLANNATYVVWVGATNKAAVTTWAGPHVVTLPEPRVHIVGLDGAARIGTGALTDDFTVTPSDATCTAKITNPPPDSPPPTGAAAPSVTLSTNTDGSRTVEVNATTTGQITVQITCTHQGHIAAVKSAVFAATEADPCALAFTWTAKAMIYKGEWSSSCMSKKRGNPGTDFHAWRYIFRLPTATTVAIDLKSSENTYLYLWGTSDDGNKVDLHNDDIDTTNNRDSRLSLRLAPGTYTIEATPFLPRTTGRFTLIVAPITTDTAHHAAVGEHWAAAFESPATPSLQTVTPPGLALTLTRSDGTATVEGTPSLAGTYTVTFAYASQLGTSHSTTTITVTCPPGHTQRTNRTCRKPLDPRLAAFVVPEAQREQGQKLYPVSQAALKGMVYAANMMDNEFQNNCDLIHEDYRLNKYLIVALLVSVQFHEVYQHSTLPASLMVVGRSDYIGIRSGNEHLYALKYPSDYPRAFWHPGVGLWQLDDENGYGSRMSHADRAKAGKGATIAATIIHDNYCSGDAAVTSEDQATEHLKSSLLKNAWFGCSEEKMNKDGSKYRVPAKCFPTLVDIVKGNSVFADTRNVESDSSYDGRLYLDVDTDLEHQYGGVTSRTCEWTGGRRNGARFLCFEYDIRKAEGYWKRFAGLDEGTLSISPLAFPFLSFTHAMTDPGGMKTDLKFIVFKASDTDYRDSDGDLIDLIAAVPKGTSVRSDPTGVQADGWWNTGSDGWWHTDTVDGSGVRIVP